MTWRIMAHGLSAALQHCSYAAYSDITNRTQI